MGNNEMIPLHVGASGYVAEVCRQLNICRMVNNLVDWDPTQCKRSPGTLTVALVLNMLSGRRPLYRVWEAFERLDLPVLFDEPVELEDLNDDALGRTLDKLYDSGNLKLLIHSAALRAVNSLPLGVRSVHADTTSISLAGRYEWTEADKAAHESNPERSLLNITHGYSKDHRPDLRQFVYGLVVSGEGLPLMGDVRSGNTSDKAWNLEMLSEIQTSFLDPQRVIYVADSALITPDNLAKMAEHRMRFVSRLPETYKLAAQLKDQAFKKGVWEPIGRLAQSEKGAVYHAQSFIERLEGRTYRFVVVHSSAKDTRKTKTLQKQVAREGARLEKAKKALEKKAFNCREDAERALSAFLGEHATALHTLRGTVIVEEIAVRQPGRPRKDEPPEIQSQYRIRLEIDSPKAERIEELLDRDSSFVLITSLDEERWSNYDVIAEYKGQTAVETRFRNLKSDPCIVDAIYVKSSRRAEALAYLFLLALLVAAFIEIKIRQELTKSKRQFLVPGKRLTDRPTMAMIFDVLESVLVVTVRSDGATQRVLPSNTDPRVFELMELMGIDESAYTLARGLNPG